MKWLKAIAVALVVLLCWTTLSFVSDGWHQLIFKVVPAAQPEPIDSITDQGREEFDWAISRYLLNGNPSNLHLQPDEQSHMTDVRRVWVGLAVLSVLGIVWLGLARPFEVLRSAAISVVVIGVATIVVFEPTFILLHQLLFPNGNWEFSAQSILVEVYPLGFFVWMWGSILALSVLTLWILGNRKARHELR